jgi:hypothetical protein
MFASTRTKDRDGPAAAANKVLVPVAEFRVRMYVRERD